MITIKNQQRKIKINKTFLTEDAQNILALLDYDDFDLGILITNNSTMRKYNKTYRNKDTSTDILSFPYHQIARAGERIIARTEEDKNLGDLIISAEYVAEQVKESNVCVSCWFMAYVTYSVMIMRRMQNTNK
jgi:rRNA maturation RNase YbeY